MDATDRVLRRTERRLRGINRAQWAKLRWRLMRKRWLMPSLALPHTADEKYLWRKMVDHVHGS